MDVRSLPYATFSLVTVLRRYFLKAIKWARKYGLRINLDLHAVPGSQNGWNHSGKMGTIGFLMGPMGYANAQRTLNHIRILAEFVSQPQYKDVVPMFGILNEPSGSPNIGQQQLAALYVRLQLLSHGCDANRLSLATSRPTTSSVVPEAVTALTRVFGSRFTMASCPATRGQACSPTQTVSPWIHIPTLLSEDSQPPPCLPTPTHHAHRGVRRSTAR